MCWEKESECSSDDVLYLRILFVVSRMDRARNEQVRRRAGIERELASRSDQRVLRWFVRLEGMDEYRMARWALMADVMEGEFGVNRGYVGWMA